VLVEQLVRAYPGFREVVSRAGYNPDFVMIDPWSMGYYGPDDHPKRRMVWALMYYKERAEDNTYARPLEGLRIVVDTIKK